jgi:hypothetical protein
MFDRPFRDAMYGINEVRNLFAHNMQISFASGIKEMADAFKKRHLHEQIVKYPMPYFSPDDKLYQTTLYDVEQVTDKRSHFIVNLKLSLMWLMGDFKRHMPYTNTWQPNISQPT